MLEKIRWKLMVFSGIGAMIVSLTLGGINQVRFSVVIIRALIFGVLFALLSQGIVILFRRFLPDLINDSPKEDDSSAETSGARYDYTMPGGDYSGEVSAVSGGEGIEADNETVELSRLDDDSDAEDAEEAEALDDVPATQPEQVSSAPAHQEPQKTNGKKDIQLNVDDSGPSFDSLPDLGDYSSAFSEKMGVEDDSGETKGPSRLDSGVTYKSRGGMHTSNDQAVEQFMSHGNEPAEMAKTISTVLKREKNST